MEILARSIDENLEQYAENLSTLLKRHGIFVEQPIYNGQVAAVPYTRNVRYEVERALYKAGFNHWLLNRQLYVYHNTDFPIELTKDRVILWGQSVPNWTAIQKQIEKVASASNLKLSFTYPLGTLSFTGDLNAVVSEFGFKNGYSPVLDMRMTVAGNTATIFQPAVGHEQIVRQTIQVSPETQRQERVENEEIDPKVATKFGISPRLLRELSSIQEGSNKLTQQLMMRRIWTELNTSKFQGKMSIPNLTLLKNTGNNMRLRGVWYPFQRRLSISPRLFNSKNEIFLEIFLHEMCHQATSEISEVYERSEGGHGPVWKGWMRKVGLDPNRYDKNTNDQYVNQDERKILDFVESHKIGPFAAHVGLHCAMFNKKTFKISECLVYNVYDRGGKTIADVVTPDKKHWMCSVSYLLWLPRYRWNPDKFASLLKIGNVVQAKKP